MKSPGFTLLTGAIVTALLLLFVVLVTTTLVRFPMSGGPETAAAGNTPAAPAAPAAAAPSADAATQPPAAAPDTDPITPTSPDAAPAGAAGTTNDTGLAVTVQPTPTRGDAAGQPAAPDAQATPAPLPADNGPGGEPPATTEPASSGDLPLPTPNPAAAPAPPLEFFGNANWVADVAFANGALWAATSGGALRWDVSDGTAQPFTMNNGLSAIQLTAVTPCPMPGFGIVFGSNGGLQVFDPATEEWKTIAANGAAVRHNDVAALACDAAQGILVVGYADNGLDIFRARPGRWSYIERSDRVAEQGVDALAIGAEGAIWVASGGALALLQGSDMTTWGPDDSPLTGEPITALAVADGNTLWLTAGNRLYRLDGDTWEVFQATRTQGDFPRGALVDVQPAQGGRVWLLSDSAEVCRFDPEFETCVPFYAQAEGMARGPARALAVEPGGTLAYATAGQGSSLLARGRWRTLAQPGGFPAGNRVFALAADANGFLWAATNSGVQQADPAQPQQVSHLYTAGRDGVVATNVRTLFADARGGIWLGGIGASHYDGRRWTHYTQADGLAGDEITAIAEDAQGRIWFGTPTGLSIWTGTTFFNLTTDNGLPNGEILSLAADGSGMWIGSAGGGLYRFEQNQLQVLTRENVGLPDNRITALLAGNARGLLVGTASGLAAVRDGQVTQLEGVPQERMTALAAAPDGSLWLGTAGSGVFRSEDGGATWAAVELEGAPLPPAVRALAVDRYNGAWIAGEEGGLVRIQP